MVRKSVKTMVVSVIMAAALASTAFAATSGDSIQHPHHVAGNGGSSGGGGGSSIKSTSSSYGSGWQLNETGWRYQEADGSYARGWRQLYWQGVQDWYLFGADSYLLGTGVYTDANGNTYYLNPVHDGWFGKMMTGELTINGQTHTFDTTSGHMLN